MTKLDRFKEEINNKEVAVLGIGISNIPLIETLSKYGANITACDKNIDLSEDIKNKLINLNVNLKLGEEYLSSLEKFEYIFRSPGIKPFLPEFKKALESGCILTSEIEEVIKLSEAKVIGITGSDGKTTTTTIISEILTESGYNVHTGGNIGTPLFSRLEDIKSNDLVVLELSSFQLMTLKESPSISLITNVSENHLDYHTNYDEYKQAKASIFMFSPNSKVVFNLDDKETESYVSLIKDKKDIKYFSLEQEIENGAYLKDDKLYYNNKYICDRNDIKLVGIHNVANILAAISVVFDLVKIKDIVNVITTFSGVEHRMELVKTTDGINWYNDSIASSPARTIAGLKSFNEDIILIAGGYDKNISYEEIGKYIVQTVKVLILLGATASKIEDSVIKYDTSNKVKIINVTTMEEAVKEARSFAKTNDKVVMSPASASFDMYKNFEHRGQDFKNLVNS